MSSDRMSASHKLNYSEDEDEDVRHYAAVSPPLHAGAMGAADGRPVQEPRGSLEDNDMRTALLNGQVRFPPNGWLTDSWFYVKNNHVCISIFLAHPSHPYTRERRCACLHIHRTCRPLDSPVH